MVRGLILAAACAVVLAVAAPARAAGGSVEVVVSLEAPSLSTAVRSSRVLTRAARRTRLDLRSPAAAGHLEALDDAQRQAERLIERIPGARVRWRYGVVLNGLAVVVPERHLDRLARVPGVARVWPTSRYRSSLDRSPALIGAPELWGADLSGAGNGMRIGIVDDGVEQDHPFFAPRGYTMPAGFPKGQAAYTNAKVIAARAFPPARPSWRHASKPFDPEHSAHGTHVAGIAAGNPGVTVNGRRLSGVAPRAQIGNYKVLTVPTPEVGLDGNAPEIAAGIEAAVRDGMHVINLSLGEPEIEPSRDLVVAAVEGAVRAGVVVTAAAGNDFDEFGRGTIGSPGTARSAITVGAADDAGDLAGFSAAGPTPLSLRLKPEVTAPGVDILSSVPTSQGRWAAYNGTSMAAPHVAGAVALLRQRHPEWTPAQVKAALVGTARPLDVGTVTRQGAGLVALPEALGPQVLASPPAVSLALVRAGATARATVRLADAGGGAGAWAVRLDRPVGRSRATVRVPATVTVPGSLVLSAAVPRAAAEGEVSGTVVLTRAGESRRLPYWLRVVRATLPAPSGRLRRTGLYRSTNAGRPARVSVYRYPEVPAGTHISPRLAGPERVFRVVIRGAVSNFGVAVVSRARGVRVEPRVVFAGNEDRLVGYTALPVHLNPYLAEFLEPRLVAGALRPRAGTYDVVFDSPSRASAGRFAFRFWIGDRTPPRAALARSTVRAGGSLVVRLSDPGAGVDPASIDLRVDGAQRPWRYRAGRLSVSLEGLPPGRHRLTGRVSDYQETRNMENEPRILPNTRDFSLAFVVR